MLPVLQTVPSIDWGQFSNFFDFTKIGTLSGGEAVGIAFVVGVILILIFKHLFSLGLLIAALAAVLTLTGVVSLSFASASALASEIWAFLSQFIGGILKVIADGGIDGLAAFVLGMAFAWFGVPGVMIHKD